MEIDLQKLDQIRISGFRPQVVFCLLDEQKTLLFYKENHKLWQFPQGGIKNNELPEQALEREIKEELGPGIFALIQGPAQFIGEEKIKFPPSTRDVKSLFTDQGEKIKMIGKKYFLYVFYLNSKDINISETEFDDFLWVDYNQGKEKAQKIYQAGKYMEQKNGMWIMVN